MSAPRQEHPRIISHSVEVQELLKGPERLSQGATFGMDMKPFGMPYKIRNTVVEFDEGRRIAWRHFGGHRWRYVLELAVFPARNRRRIEETLANLKSAAEADAARA